jgi:hypothetical protein
MKASVLQHPGCRKYFIVVDFNVVHYVNGPLTTIWRLGLIITAIFAVPLFSTICSTLLKVDHTALKKIEVSSLTP